MGSKHVEILLVSHKYPPATGGMEKQSYELINGLALYTRVHTIIYDNKESILTFFYKLNKRILKKLRRHPTINVIHFNDGLIASFATFHKGYEGLKKVVTIHGLDVVFPLPYFQNKILLRFNHFDRIIAVSQATADAAVQRGIWRDKVTVINNGVDHLLANEVIEPISSLYLKYPQINRNAKYFITLGRPVKRKGFSWLINEVIPKVVGDYQLIMIGPFDKKPTLKERFLDLLPSKSQQLISLFLGLPTDQKDLRSALKKQDSKVIHLGKVPFDDLKIFLANGTAFLMPNVKVDGDMEGFGLVCLEASLAGTLVIASELEGITNAIKHRYNGLLLESQNPQAWIEELQYALSNPKTYQNLAEQYKQNTKNNYSWDKMSREYLVELEKILHSNN